MALADDVEAYAASGSFARLFCFYRAAGFSTASVFSVKRHPELTLWRHEELTPWLRS
jgi:hypothetical protein